jgi:glyceraldehyde-3-phosphate dehydrogenase (NADP+)
MTRDMTRDMPNTTDSALLHLFPKKGEIPTEWQIEEPVHQKEYLLNGQMVQWNGALQEVLSPVCQVDKHGNLNPVVVGSYPICGEKEAMAALEAAVAAYDSGRGEWPTLSVHERIEAMERFTAMMVEKKAEIVRLLMFEIGKTKGDSTKEFDRTIAYMNDTMDELKDMDREGSRFHNKEGIIAQIRRAPLGVVLVMGPFNYPLNETFCLLIPALLMGNTVVFKTPKHGSLLHYPLLECFAKAFPAGVVNTLYGRGADVVPPLMKTGQIDVLALIGSSRVADSLKKAHPKTNRLRAILGLDAKNVAIVLPDADLDLAVKECVLGSLSFNGQRCTALKLLFVHKDVVDTFVERFSAACDTLKAGMPWEAGVQITPLPEPGKPGYLKEVMADALAKGAAITNTKGGNYAGPMIYPTVLYPVTEGMKVYREEQFGPIVPIVAYSEVEEPIQYMETSHHGQQISIFGKDATALAELIDPMVNLVCRVNINAQCQRGPDMYPFTGRRDSAEGTLSVQDALRSFSIRTMVATKDTETNKEIINTMVREQDSSFVSTRYLL